MDSVNDELDLNSIPFNITNVRDLATEAVDIESSPFRSVLGYLLCETRSTGVELLDIDDSFREKRSRIPILLDELRHEYERPHFNIPQPAMVMGEICLVDETKEIVLSRTNSNKIEINNALKSGKYSSGIRAFVVENIPPSLVHSLNSTILKITTIIERKADVS